MPDMDATTRILVISDLHGDIEAMDLLHHRLAGLGMTIDMVIFAGDFSNFFFQGLEAVAVFPLVLQQFERFEVPVYFIRGNRDQNMQMRKVLPVSFKNGISIEDRMVTARGIAIAGHLATDPGSLPVDESTIVVTHDEAHLPARPLLHVAGHVHAARVHDRFLNAGFLHRTPDHGTKVMNGIFWFVDVATPAGSPASITSIAWHALEGKDDKLPGSHRRFPFKEHRCPVHPAAGTWVLPFYWKKCQWCYGGGSRVT